MRLAIASGVLTAAAALGGCSQSDTAPGPGGVTMGEARALDDAAEMLDARQLPAEALQPSSTHDAASDPGGAATEGVVSRN